MDLVQHIYHEKQEPGSMLCGQHALNNLLQSSLFTPQDLADIARQLDAMEAAQLDPGTHLRGEGESQNYDDSGFFSVQVMDKAMEILGLRLVRWGSKDMEAVHKSPELVEAFLLNHQLHWFSIRRFGPSPDRFYNLDSCVSQPSWVSSMYLGLTLREAENQGYSIFAVVPSADSAVEGLPPCAAAEKAVNLPPPDGGGAYSNNPSSANTSFSGEGHSLGSTSSSSSTAGPSSQPYPNSYASTSKPQNPFSSALYPSLSFGSSAFSSTSDASSRNKGKRPASLTLSDSEDDVLIEDPATYGNGSLSGSEGRRQRRKLEAQIGAGGQMGPGEEAYEEEMMARAVRESLRVSGQDGVDEGGGVGQQSRAALAEEEELERAIQASLAAAGTSAEAGGSQVVEAKPEEEDSPTMEELRQRRLARFGG
ncbi:hypothetical protein JCM11641_005746 [Rhodosporidiobolus odoratus]